MPANTYPAAVLPPPLIDPAWPGRPSLDASACLHSTVFIESEHPEVRTTAQSMVDRIAPEEHAARVAAMFRFVRDGVTYEFLAKLDREDYRASIVLERRRGFCVQKAVLLAALARAIGIPSALVMTDLRDHTLPARITDGMRTNVLFQHALTAFHVGGRWVRADATLSPDLCRRQGYHLVEFDGTVDALLPAETRDGRRHSEYLGHHGMFADLPYDRVMHDFRHKYEGGDPEMLVKVGVRPRV